MPRRATATAPIITGGTGACTPASYWDIGVRGDTGPSNHSSGLTLAPIYSVLTDARGLPRQQQPRSQSDRGAASTATARAARRSSCRSGYQVPPGIADAPVPNPIFNLTPAATVDEGNNWINISWGPLAQTGPVTSTLLGNYALANGSPAINYIPLASTGGVVAPNTDFFGNPRPAPGSRIDVGAVEFQGTDTPLPTVSPDVLNFGNVVQGSTAPAQTLTLSNPQATALTGIGITVTAPFSRTGGTCGATLGAGASCTINIAFTAPAALGTVNGTATLAGSAAIGGSPVALSGNSTTAPTLTSIAPNTGVRGSSVTVTLTGTNFSTLGSTVNVPAGSGITVSNVTVSSDSAITATLTIAANATVATRNISVTTGGLTTNSVPFTITSPPPPTLTSILPNAHTRGGGPFAVTLTGTNFTAGARVTVSGGGGFGGGIFVTAVNVVSPTTITANFTILGFATRGARNVTVATVGGTSAPVTFTVN